MTSFMKTYCLWLHVYLAHSRVFHPQAVQLLFKFTLSMDALCHHHCAINMSTQQHYHHHMFGMSAQAHLHLTFDMSAQHYHYHPRFHHHLIVKTCAQCHHHSSQCHYCHIHIQKLTQIRTHHLPNITSFHQHPFTKDVHQAPNPRPQTTRMALRRCCSMPCMNMPASY